MTQEKSGPASAESGIVEMLQVIYFFRKWSLLIASMMVVGACVVFVVLCARGPGYDVTAMLYYKLGREQAPSPTVDGNQVMVLRRKEDVNNEIEILSSPHLMRDVVNELGEEYFRIPDPTTTFGKVKKAIKDAIEMVKMPFRESLIRVGLRPRLTELEKITLILDSRFSVDAVSSSDTIVLKLSVSSPDAGVEILEKILEKYQELRVKAHQDSGVEEFFSQQTTEFRQRLEQSNQALLEFQNAEELSSPEEQRRMLLTSFEKLRTQHATTNTSIAYLETERANLGSLYDEMPEELEIARSSQLSPTVEDTSDRLATMRRELAVVNATYVVGSAEHAVRRQAIAELEGPLDSQPQLIPFSNTKGINQNRQDIAKLLAIKQAEAKGLKSQLLEEEEQLAKFAARIGDLESAISRFTELNREHELLERNYELYAENLEKSRISSVMNLSKISNIRLISPPTASLMPRSPRLKLSLAAGLAAGFTFGVATGLMLELRRYTLSLGDDMNE